MLTSPVDAVVLWRHRDLGSLVHLILHTPKVTFAKATDICLILIKFPVQGVKNVTCAIFLKKGGEIKSYER